MVITMVWKISTIKTYIATPEAFAAFCVEHGIDVVSFKLGDGSFVFAENWAVFPAWYAALDAAGVGVGVWHYCYPAYIDQQVSVAKRITDQYSLDHYAWDAEREWKTTGAALAARRLLDGIEGTRAAGISGLCSYRYPKSHGNFPWRAWLDHRACMFNMPQVYWEGSHNPAYQVGRSRLEFADITTKPFIPIGSSYARGSWVPTDDDIESFERATRIDAYRGLYSLDYLLKLNKINWLDMFMIGDPPPPPPPPPPIGVGDIVRVSAGGSSLYTHITPDAEVSTRNGYLPDNLGVKVDDTQTVGGRLWLKSGIGWFAGWLVEKENQK